MSYVAEYVWLDGHKPEPLLRSKIKVERGGIPYTPEEVPDWSFDGSSTEQADGGKSDCLLKPVRVYQASSMHMDSPWAMFPPWGMGIADTRKSPLDGIDVFVLCEVLDADGSPHKSNTRDLVPEANLRPEEANWWFGFEQEYVITKNGRVLGWPEGNTFPRPQGDYYCGVGGNSVVGRDLMLTHLSACRDLGIQITGTNAEVMLGQWEYQCFSEGARKSADDLWMSRYLLYRIAEAGGMDVNISPKPISGDWNGNGLHTNFSYNAMRDEGGVELFTQICENLRRVHQNHIAVYGSDNGQRLTGEHETQHIDQFSYGVSDRGASIRIPIATVQNDWKGYLEDRRPAGNADPYKVVARIIDTLTF